MKPLADLRVRVFREYPYLYQGTAEAEEKYLQPYLDSTAGFLVTVRDGEHIVGASTALPLVDADTPFQDAFTQHNHDPSTVFYFGESVLLPDYRGRGTGHTFFAERENFARQQGFRKTAFCAVVRPDNHPRRPALYHELAPFWTSRGYRKQDGLICHYYWLETGHTEETAHEMQFWLKTL
ncbi:MAG: GNAT family N-acetyltransferase [Pseudomonadales bacterium]|nr:GNAT family N-acetyltransferase [Pseudomonadales bacterium]